MNDGRSGTTRLPTNAADGAEIMYVESDVYIYTGAHRGEERIVLGSDGSIWYTPDHYVSWERIDE